MSEGLAVLCLTAASIGFLHTLLGPDHYLPFVAMARAGGWTLRRTMWITLLCGIGHVLGSVVLGLIGIALGVGVFRLETVEAFRGDLAGWLLLAFGLAYLVWGVRAAIRNRPHAHWHTHADGTVHKHEHVHTGTHAHVHADEAGQSEHAAAPARMTPWVLFTIFVFGPCEPLIPLLMYPAAKGAAWHVAIVTAIFAATTLMTMLTAVAMMRVGLKAFPLHGLERYAHVTAGFVVAACGAAVVMGL